MYLGPSWDRRYQLTSRRSTTERRSTSQNSTKFYSKTRSKLIPQDIMMSYVSRSMKQDSSPKQPNSKVMEAKSNEAEGDFKFPRYRNYGKAVDWYSFGVISHQLYCFGTVGTACKTFGYDISKYFCSLCLCMYLCVKDMLPRQFTSTNSPKFVIFPTLVVTVHIVRAIPSGNIKLVLTLY